MRLARVNITIPDELLAQAKTAGLNLSRTASLALAAEVERLAKVADLDRYLEELTTELGPLSEDEQAAARIWADRAFGEAPSSSRRTRTA